MPIYRVWSLVDIEQDVEVPDGLTWEQTLEAIQFGTVDDVPVETEWSATIRQGEFTEAIEVWDETGEEMLWGTPLTFGDYGKRSLNSETTPSTSSTNTEPSTK